MEHIRQLGQLETLELQQIEVTDSGIAHLRGLQSLRRLRLNANPDITDAALVHVSALGNLEDLYLDGARISDVGLVHLAKMKNLKTLALMNTAASVAGIAKLQTALPKCKISW